MKKYFDIGTYQGFVNSGAFDVLSKIVTDKSLVVADTCYWDSTLKAMLIHDSGTSLRGGFVTEIGRLDLGDKVKISCEVMVLSGDSVGVYVDLNSVNVGNVLSTKIGVWETLEMTIESPIFDTNTMKGIASVYWGSVTNTASKYYIRNCRCEVDCNQSYVDKSIPLDFKTYNINITGSTNETMMNLTRGNTGSTTFFSQDSCIIASGTNTTSNHQGLKVTHGKPFTCPHFRGLVMAQLAGNTPTSVEVRVEGHTNEFFWLVFYDTTTNTVINPTTLYETYGKLWVQVFCIGGTGYSYSG